MSHFTEIRKSRIDRGEAATTRARDRYTLNHRHSAIAGAVSLILATAAAQGQNASPQVSSQNSAPTLKEIVVTAQRRRQTVQDIPYNISVVSGNDVGGPGVTNATDLSKLVPGLLAVDTGPAARGDTNSFTLRGLRTDDPGSVDFPTQTTSPVSTYFGETPVFFPLVLQDIDRVEILRGPQGTLYGAGAEAGTIRFIPNRPQFGQFSGSVSTSTGKTENAGSFNNSITGILNLPVASNLAVRLVAGEEHLAGFITDVGLAVRQGTGPDATPVPRVAGDPTSGFVIAPPLRDANTSNQSYARAEVRWDPTEKVDLQLTYQHQNTHVNDCQCSNPTWPGGQQNLASAANPTFPNSSYTVPAGGPYQNTNLIQQPYDNTVNLGNLVASVDLGLATFTSSTSAYKNDTDGTKDNTYEFYVPGGTNFLTYYNNYPRTIADERDGIQDKSIIQEMRLVSNGTHVLDYVVGLYYQKEETNTLQNQLFGGLQQYYTDTGIASPNPELGDLVVLINMGTAFIDRAAYGELTWHITPKLQLTGGTRVFSQAFDVNFAEELPNCGPACGNQYGGFFVYNHQGAQNHLFKLNAAYDITPHTKVYATYSEGFRRGGATGVPPVGIYASESKYFTYSPDYSKNYEIGVKGTVASRLMYTADIFVINLDNFQFDSETPSGLPVVYNGSTARSKGAELQLNARLTSRTIASFGYSYTDARVLDPTNIYDLPAFGGPGSTPVLTVAIPEGTRLPGVPENAFTAGLDYRLPVGSSNWTSDFHVDGTYRTSAPGAIPGVYVGYWEMEDVKVLNTRVTFENGEHWTFSLFGTNLTGDPEYSGAVGEQGTPPNALNYRDVSRPRTVGITAQYDF